MMRKKNLLMTILLVILSSIIFIVPAVYAVTKNYVAAKSSDDDCCGCAVLFFFLFSLFFPAISAILKAFISKKYQTQVQVKESNMWVKNEPNPVNTRANQEWSFLQETPPELDKELPPIDEKKVKIKLGLLKKKDPNFRMNLFFDRVQNVYLLIYRAWSNGNLEPVRNLMTDSQYKKLEKELSNLKNRGLTNKVENIRIGAVFITDINQQGDYDYIKVRIHSTATDKTFDRYGSLCGGSDTIKNFVQYWTFIRRLGVKTAQYGTGVRSICPSCGAPLKIGENTQCEYCDSIISAASFDWVVDAVA